MRTAAYRGFELLAWLALAAGLSETAVRLVTGAGEGLSRTLLMTGCAAAMAGASRLRRESLVESR
jgi:hypothetical protein